MSGTTVYSGRQRSGRQARWPALMLLPVIFMAEARFSRPLCFPGGSEQALAVVALAAGAALAAWRPRLAAAFAVAGAVLLALVVGAASVRTPLVLPSVQAVALLVLAAATAAGSPATRKLAPGWPVIRTLACAGGASGGPAANQRPDRILGAASRVTTPAARLGRVERDLRGRAQVRLIALDQALRGAQRLLPENPEAALALILEAREAAARALDDLGNLVLEDCPQDLAAAACSS